MALRRCPLSFISDRPAGNEISRTPVMLPIVFGSADAEEEPPANVRLLHDRRFDQYIAVSAGDGLPYLVAKASHAKVSISHNPRILLAKSGDERGEAGGAG